ncbi:MAG: type II secretion system major pseudopilin GspG [Gammaproteobacteria bacterium]|nr:type II secretion system major pseudopilin GspG [Gammaproteobacteria bacterium]MCY4282287.1 type II secretion system major pseudopilin GspG [Gammaproteobacteria bacterium]MCY4339464.1 type II secretion system major pseudopilin GspG [Gammaproteobacteria bacterium]
MLSQVHRRGATRVRHRGFTLIEVMIVIVVLSVLAALVVPNIMGRPDEARIAAAKIDLRSIANALALYKLDHHTYPTTNQGLEALVNKPAAGGAGYGGYLQQLPKDPWGNEYLYLSPGAHGPYDLYSLGADARQGGSGVSADITSWEK